MEIAKIIEHIEEAIADVNGYEIDCHVGHDELALDMWIYGLQRFIKKYLDLLKRQTAETDNSEETKVEISDIIEYLEDIIADFNREQIDNQIADGTLDEWLACWHKAVAKDIELLKKEITK